MSSRLQKIALGSLIAFLIIALNLTYWSVIERDGLRARSDNPRRIEDERAIVRGSLLDRNGIVLAHSEPSGRLPSGRLAQQRVYPHSAAFSVTGYYSLIYGSSGAEFAFDRLLRGAARADVWSAVLGEALNRPPQGEDVRLTVDASLQAIAQEAFGARRGALVLLEVPSGAIRALYSAPLYNPNTLDADWARLRADPRAPLLNRALQGAYKMGGALQLVIYSAMLANPAAQLQDLTRAADPIRLDGLTISCLVESPSTIESLSSALARGCPSPFAEFALAYPAEVQEKIGAFGLLSALRLDGYPTAPEPMSPPLDSLLDSADRLRAAVGQGDLSVTPLHMALLASGIANNGNLVTPYIAEAVRPPNSETWQPLPRLILERAATTREAASRIRAALREAVLSGNAQAAASPNLPPEVTLYAYASLAFSADGRDGWLIGFVDLPDGRALAIAVVVEDVEDADVAARIGGRVLAAAARRSLQK